MVDPAIRRPADYRDWVSELWSDPAEDGKLPTLDELLKLEEHRRLNEAVQKRMNAQAVVQDDILTKLYWCREGGITSVKRYKQACLREKEGERICFYTMTTLT